MTSITPGFWETLFQNVQRSLALNATEPWPLLGRGKGHLVDHLDLGLVGVLGTGGDGTAGLSAGVDGDLVLVVLSLLQGGDQSRLDIGPSTVVQRLLLSPHQLGVGVLVEVRGEEVVRQRAKLLKSRDRDVVDSLVLSLLQELVVDLTRAENVSSDLLRSDEVLRVRLGEVSLERSAVGHLLQSGSSKRVSQQSLGEEDDELEG